MSKATSQIVIPRLAIIGASARQMRFAEEVLAENYWLIIARDRLRRIKEVDHIENIVVTEGLNKYLDATLKTGLASPAWYVGLTDGTPTVDPTDTMSLHAGWNEVYTEYDETTRPVWTPGTIAAGSVDNDASKARFTFNTNSTTVGGAFMPDDNTKNGVTGTLLAAGAFTLGDKEMDDTETLDVRVTATQAAA